MGEIGSFLKSNREHRKITLTEAEEATKISRRYLEALEADEYQELPGQVYAVGFLRSYARYLEIDEETIEHLILEFKDKLGYATTKIQAPSTGGKGTSEHRRNSRPGRSFIQLSSANVLYVVAFLLLVSALGFIYWGFGKPADSNPNLVLTQPTNPSGQPVPDSSNSIPPAGEVNPISENVPLIPPNNENPDTGTGNLSSESENADSFDLELVVLDATCWMQIIVDGNEQYMGTLNKGESQKFTVTDKLYVHAGNGGLVEVFRNGQSQGNLGYYGEVVRKEFTKTI